ncbi:hypothetical protein SAMN02745150_01172 [Brevinema andersonii]|uniref:Uncharacterized protein n=1 Tax=Brevinema andersonii TaxID=34097 RepID=A0A1I1ETK4_BREAD|nr:hypothetical protein [Brevinema andersonii]SFB88223.1 hypothetical protein SAMN02745150_01172 [Brevinema andersonii]
MKRRLMNRKKEATYLQVPDIVLEYPLKEKEFPEIVMPNLGIVVWCKEGSFRSSGFQTMDLPYREFHVIIKHYEFFKFMAPKIQDSLLMKECESVLPELKKEYALTLDDVLNIFDAILDKAREFTKKRLMSRYQCTIRAMNSWFERD